MLSTTDMVAGAAHTRPRIPYTRSRGSVNFSCDEAIKVIEPFSRTVQPVRLSSCGTQCSHSEGRKVPCCAEGHLSRLQHVTADMVNARMPRLQLEGVLDRFEERTAKTGWSNLARSPSLLEVNANLSRRLADSPSPILKASRRSAPMGSLKVKRCIRHRSCRLRAE